MKTSTALIIAALMLASCGTAARYASDNGGQMYHDGIYSSAPTFASTADKAVTDNEVKSLVEETKASAIYLFGDKKDTIMIPEAMSAKIQFTPETGTTVTLYDNPYNWMDDFRTWGWYTPYSLRFSWGYPYGSWRYSWHMSVHNPYYWHYGGLYDPWYYDPWYGYAGWYDPWYSWGRPWHGYHYCGWYGGWDPYWRHHHKHHLGHHRPGIKPNHNGGKKNIYTVPRHQTGSDKFRSGQGVSRNSIASTGSSSTRETAVRTRTKVTRSESSSMRPAAGRRSTTGTTTSSKVNYRKPTSTGTSSSSGSTTSYTRSGSSSSKSSSSTKETTKSSSSSYNRSSSSSYSRNSSSSGYSRSSGSSSYSRSSSGSSGYSRGSTGGGGYSRSGR